MSEFGYGRAPAESVTFGQFVSLKTESVEIMPEALNAIEEAPETSIVPCGDLGYFHSRKFEHISKGTVAIKGILTRSEIDLETDRTAEFILHRPTLIRKVKQAAIGKRAGWTGPFRYPADKKPVAATV